MFKPYKLLSYVLFPGVGFFLGLAYAKVTGAGADQGLAAAAIVLGNGAVGALIGLFMSFILARNLKAAHLIQMNWLLGIVLLGSLGYLAWNYCQHAEGNSKSEIPEGDRNPIPTKPAPDAARLKYPAQRIKGFQPEVKNAELAMNFLEESNIPEIDLPNENMGVGMFAPTLWDTPSFYFYSVSNWDKSILDYSPSDSIVFKSREGGGVVIESAPPWLFPEHLKLDYDLFLFKAVSVSTDFVEVEVNKATGLTSFVDRRAGQLKYWPDFLLSVNSVELLEPQTQKIHLKPLKHSSSVTIEYSFLKPVRIKGSWMSVKLLNEDFAPVGTGWIVWKNGERLLIKYSIFS